MEMNNLAHKKEQATRLKEMRSLLQQDLEAIGRPFGEFITGGNTSKPGQIDKQIEIVKQLDIQGKTVTVPRTLAKNLEENDESTPNDKAECEARRKARQEAKTNNQEAADK